MNQNLKVVLITVGVILSLCIVCAVGSVLVGGFAMNRVADSMVNDDPAEARSFGAEIADYDLPEGYSETGIINVFVGRFLLIETGEVGTAIMLVQMSDMQQGGDDEQFRAQMELSVRQSLYRNFVSVELLDEFELTIRGQQVPAFFYQAEDENGEQFHQLVTGIFPGKNGINTMVMAIGPVTGWNMEEITSFLESFR